MKYLNVSVLGLTGRPHPAITGVTTSHEVKKMRPHIKMLTGNYLTFEIKSQQSGGSPECHLCPSDPDDPVSQDQGSIPNESLQHLISQCSKFEDLRKRIKSSIETVCNNAKLKIEIETFSNNEFTQFILDPSSLNLKKRVNISHPALPELFKLSRDYCYAIDRTRTQHIK